MGTIAVMLGHEKALFVGLNTPTQLDTHGAKTTRPSPVVAAPPNLYQLLLPKATAPMLGHVRLLVDGLNTPTQLAVPGAKTTTPLTKAVASLNWSHSVVTPVMFAPAVLRQVNVPSDGGGGGGGGDRLCGGGGGGGGQPGVAPTLPPPCRQLPHVLAT